MKPKRWMLAILVVIMSLFVVIAALAAGNDDIAKLQAATAQFKRTEVAQEAGWDLVPGLDHCV